MQVNSFEEFRSHWGGLHNFLIGNGLIPFDYEAPPLHDLLDLLRHDPDSRFLLGTSDVNNFSREEPPAEWKSIPIEEFAKKPFNLGHFDITKFDRTAGLLEGFTDGVVEPLRSKLERGGFSFSDWLKPYIFSNGPGCCSTYHMDFSHVLAWQQYGVKHFCSFRNPDHYATPVQRRAFMDLDIAERPGMPDSLQETDIVDHEMGPGSLLWNAFNTPHWVCAGDSASLSINISFRGLRLDGTLCPREIEVDLWREQKESA